MDSLRTIGPGRVKVVLTQGLKRQIRLMFYRVGREVTRLTRVRIGGVRLGSLRPGQWKILDAREVAKLVTPPPPRKPPLPKARQNRQP
jgi:16S rRNA U516 pseudouridylate synthase RsuA-like enzyme